MQNLLRHLLLAFLLFAVVGSDACAADPNPIKVAIPAGINHSGFDRLLQKYVDDRGLVAYGKWKANAKDVAALDAYLEEFAPKPAQEAKGDEVGASVINAYNATGIRFIIEHYPLDSIRKFEDAFSARTHLVGGEKVALDDLENGVARPVLGWRAHAGLVCCAKSCPPLRRDAYTAENLNGNLDEAFRIWLARPDLNRFQQDKNAVEISSIFNWFKEDFEKGGGVEKVLGRFGPDKYRDFFERGKYEIKFLEYDWALNDQS